jgi:hypothetical protein
VYTCSDCHNPHSLNFLPGPELRLQPVPLADEVRRSEHHHHESARPGALCSTVTCRPGERTWS